MKSWDMEITQFMVVVIPMVGVGVVSRGSLHQSSSQAGWGFMGEYSSTSTLCILLGYRLWFTVKKKKVKDLVCARHCTGTET